MINIEVIKRILKKGKMVLIPFGLVGATILTGCSTTKQEDKVIKSTERLGLSYSLIDEGLYDFDECNIYKVNTYSSYSVSGEIYNVSEQLTPLEFGEYTGEVNVTYDDVRTTIKESNFDDRIKNTLLNGVNNLEKSLPNLNLSVLNYNLKNITIVSENEYEYNECDGFIAQGLFEPYEHIVYLPTSTYESPNFDSIVLHEILGHGSEMAHCDDKYCSTTETIFISENKNVNEYDLIDSSLEVGHSLNEAVAEMIAVLGTGKKIKEDLEEYDSPYDVYVEQLQLYLKSTDTTLTEYINNGFEYLMTKMKNAGCNSPLNYVIDFDSRKQLLVEDSFIYSDTLVEEMQTDYLYEIAAKKLENGEDKESVIKFVCETVDSVNSYLVPTFVDGQKGVVWSTPDCYEVVDFGELKQNVKVKIK